MNFTRASDFYFTMYSYLCFVLSSTKSSIYPSLLIAVSSRLHMSECTSCRGSVAWEVVFRVKDFLVDWHLIQHLQLHLPVILGASVIVSRISKP